MRVFVTGAPGFIGQAVTKELLDHGHQVVGLARSDASAEKVSKLGAEVYRGDIEDLDSLRKGAKDADGVIHLAFIHDFSDFANGCRVDQEAIRAMAGAMEGTSKPLVIASGTLSLLKDKPSTEDSGHDPNNSFSIRGKGETILAELSKEKNVRGATIRLAPTVHGKGDKAFIPMLSGMAKKAGFVTKIGDGKNVWPAVHRDDAAVLYRLALEKGKAGSVYHAIAEDVEMNQILETMGKGVDLPVETKSMEDALQAVGFFAYALANDNPVSSKKTQEELGWQPKQLGLIADMKANYY